MKQKKKQAKNKKLNQNNKSIENETIAVSNTSSKPLEKDYKYALPISEIKRDLLKTTLYAVFALGVIFTLNYLISRNSLQFDLSRYKFF